MKNTLIILISLLLFSNCTKTNSFNVATDLKGEWLVKENSDIKTFYTFFYKGNNNNVMLKRLVFPYNPFDDSDGIQNYIDYPFQLKGNIISINDNPIHLINEDNTSTSYFILSNKEKNKIILMNTKNKSQITLIKQ